MSTDHLGPIQRLAGDIADYHTDDRTYQATQGIIGHAAEQQARIDSWREYAEWLESWAAGPVPLNARHMAQERQRLIGDREVTP